MVRMVENTWKGIIIASAALKIFLFLECTSFDVGGHSDMLAEPCHLKGAAQGIGLAGTYIEVADD